MGVKSIIHNFCILCNHRRRNLSTFIAKLANYTCFIGRVRFYRTGQDNSMYQNGLPVLGFKITGNRGNPGSSREGGKYFEAIGTQVSEKSGKAHFWFGDTRRDREVGRYLLHVFYPSCFYSPQVKSGGSIRKDRTHRRVSAALEKFVTTTCFRRR